MAKKKYTDEFRTEAVKVAREAKRSGKTNNVVARELGVHPNTLADWVQTDDLAHAGSGKNTDDLPPEQELEQLRKENRLLKMEREILKKAAAFFAKERDERVRVHRRGEGAVPDRIALQSARRLATGLLRAHASTGVEARGA
jgi:transposase